MNAIDQDAGSVGSFADAILAEEARRNDRDHAPGRSGEEVPDDLLPGVGRAPMSMREGLAAGGAFTFVVLLVLNSLDELETAALTLLAPNIRDTFGVSDGTITFVASASAAFIVLGAFPMGWLADHYRRGRIVGLSSLAWTCFVFLTGLASNAFVLFWTRFGVGIAKSNTMPVHGSLIADTYPVRVRGRLAATTQMFGRAIAAISPLAIGGIVVAAGGDEAWRWAFFLIGIPVAVFALLAFRLPEPTRGQWEKQDVLSEVFDDGDAPLVSLEASFARLMRIRTLRSVVIAFSAVGFVIFTIAVQSSLFLEDEYGLGVLGRGIVTSVAGLGGAIVLPFVGARFDRTYRDDPARALRLIGWFLAPVAVLVPLQFSMPNPVLFATFDVARVALSAAAFGMIAPIAQAIVPYRLRGMGMAIITIYVFFVGAVGGSLLAAVLTDAFSVRFAVSLLSFGSITVGAYMLMRGARHIREDLAMIVEELRDEQEEHQRRTSRPESVPALQLSHVDFSYGQVQVLFDLSFEVGRGETLALLGTNGAGKSTALRVVAGLSTPERGTVRLGGRTITFAAPEQRARLGIQLLPGGRGTFPDLTVHDNLVVGAYAYRRDAAEVARRIERVMDLFPVLADRRDERARDLSGGQQQILALGRVMLHDPDVLLIDELSLGLAPAVVQDLLHTIDALRSAGQTMVIVEQSLNVALSIADRAVFLEKGEVRFEGSTHELASRGDLARAVFLGSDPR